ncbi:helix-turn-helix domain-containing protein [bacterium]|nr:MAG: helix-turn-helix domain-containing protein [bacterium]
MTLPQYLKSKREEIGETVEDISTRSKVSKEYIYAIESGDYSIFEAEVFRKGWIKIYARLLNLDEEYVLALDRRENPNIQSKPIIQKGSNKYKVSLTDQKVSQNSSTNSNKKLTSIERFQKPKFFFTKSKVSFIVGVILAIGFVFFGLRQFRLVNESPELNLNSPITLSMKDMNEDSVTQTLTTNKSQITISGNIDPNDQLYIQGALSRWNSTGQFRFENYMLNKGENVLKIEAKNKLGKSSVIELKIIYDETEPTFTTSSSTSISL